jgi:hypothetical protein
VRETLVKRPTGHRVPTLHDGATGFMELRRTRLRCNLAATSRLDDPLQARLVVGGLATEPGTVDPIPNRSAYLSTNGALSSVCCDTVGPEVRCELLPPAPERCLANI